VGNGDVEVQVRDGKVVAGRIEKLQAQWSLLFELFLTVSAWPVG